MTRLLAGARACPPEDCGGVPGYEDMVEFLASGESPQGDDADTLREWLDGWEPETFNLEEEKTAFDR
jgi:hypothetical protein